MCHMHVRPRHIVYMHTGLKLTLVTFWNFIGGVSYHFDDEGINREKPQEKCRGMGGNLPSFTSQDDINIIIDLITDQNWEYWTGLKYNKSDSSGSWIFDDGTNTSFALTLFDATRRAYPSGHDECVLISGAGELRATTCDEGRKYICQITQHEITTDITASSG